MSSARAPARAPARVPATEVVFEERLTQWTAAQERFRRAKRAYDEAYARALLTSKGANKEAREADADLGSMRERAAYDEASVEAERMEHLIEWMGGRRRADDETHRYR